jgi:phosphoenolpyruvate synthase/pyruvate phosphate dikinase
VTTIDLRLGEATDAAARVHSVDFCVPLAQAVDERAVGGKAYALGRMLRAGVDVPDGFVLTARAFDLQVACLPVASTDVASMVRASGLAPAVREQLMVHAAPLLARGPVVVRSSAIGEDGAAESFAGQLDSILHVADHKAVEDAVRAVWA